MYPLSYYETFRLLAIFMVRGILIIDRSEMMSQIITRSHARHAEVARFRLEERIWEGG